MPSNITERCFFVVDGRDNAIKGYREKIQKAVMEKYREELSLADDQRRSFLFRLIEQEVAEELGKIIDKIAPGDAFY